MSQNQTPGTNLSILNSNAITPVGPIDKNIIEETGLAQPEKIGSSLSPVLLDIEWLRLQPLLPFLVQVAPAHLLYRSIMAHGIEDSMEVIEWVRGEQLQKILDFDIWAKSPELQTEDISTQKFLVWLGAWLEIGSEFAAERTFELEEETLVLIFSQLFEILPDGVTHITDDIRNQWWLTQDRRFFLRVRDEYPMVVDILKHYVDALYQTNVKLTASLFAYSAMLIRQEALDSGLRWRRSRLADQGFVSPREAQQILAPKKDFNLFAKSSLVAGPSYSSSFSVQDPEEHERIVTFLSSLEPDEGARHLELALGKDTLKQISGRVAGAHHSRLPEYLYDDEDFIQATVGKILAECKATLTRYTLCNENKVLKSSLLIEKVLAEITEQEPEKALLFKESIAYVSNILVAGTANSYDNSTLEHYLLVTRGILNIALETDIGYTRESEPACILAGINSLCTRGIDLLFQSGWNILLFLVKELEISLAKNMNLGNKQLVNKLVWLNGIEGQIPAEIFVTLQALFHQVPMYPELLSNAQSTQPIYVSRGIKPFETLEEIEKVRNFIKNLDININLSLCKN